MESHLQALTTYLSAHPGLALGAVFAAALLEALAVIGTVIPGSSIVFVGGVLVGLGALDPVWTAAAAVAGAIVGDGISFWLGRHHHERLRAMWPLRTHPAWFERGQAYFALHGGKSVFLGRFLGPVRAIVPVVAGMSDMPAARFYAVNVLSAFAWAAAHLLPGMLFGASLQLAGAISSRLLILLAIVLLGAWTLGGLVRAAHRRGAPFVARLRDRLVARARAGAGALPRLVLSLFDPARPESPGLLVAAALLLGGAWLFLGVLQDVISNDPLVRFDHVVFAALQGLRTAWVDDAMVTATELGSAAVALPLIAAVALLLALARCWRTLAYWLAAMGFAEALVWTLKLTVERTRPTALYSGAEQFSFPSGHAASSIVLYGFLAFLLARGRSTRGRVAITLAAALAIGLISFSRLYLGAHWLSDVLASLGLGTAWVALLGIAYTRHVRDERVPSRALLYTALATLAVAGAVQMSSHHDADVARYAPQAPTPAVLLPDWRGTGWQHLAAHRTEIDGEADEPMALQWAAPAERIKAALTAAGWRVPAPWASRAALLWLLPSTPIGELPVLAKFHQGEPPRLTFEQALDDRHRLVVRLWASADRVDAAGGAPSPLWLGMVTIERAEHPAGLFTAVATEADYATPVAQLAQALTATPLAVPVALARRHRGDQPVLLVW